VKEIGVDAVLQLSPHINDKNTIHLSPCLQYVLIATQEQEQEQGEIGKKRDGLTIDDLFI
jgi:hypothetical protein